MNTHVQHVVNTVEVEESKLIKETVQRKKPIDQEKINQVTKHIDVPQVQFLDKADDMPVVVQRQVYMTNEEVAEVPRCKRQSEGGTYQKLNGIYKQLAKNNIGIVVRLRSNVVENWHCRTGSTQSEKKNKSSILQQSGLDGHW